MRSVQPVTTCSPSAARRRSSKCDWTPIRLAAWWPQSPPVRGAPADHPDAGRSAAVWHRVPCEGQPLTARRCCRGSRRHARLCRSRRRAYFWSMIRPARHMSLRPIRWRRPAFSFSVERATVQTEELRTCHGHGHSHGPCAPAADAPSSLHCGRGRRTSLRGPGVSGVGQLPPSPSARYRYTVSRWMPYCRASWVLGTPAAATVRSSVTCSAVSAGASALVDAALLGQLDAFQLPLADERPLDYVDIQRVSSPLSVVRLAGKCHRSWASPWVLVVSAVAPAAGRTHVVLPWLGLM